MLMALRLACLVGGAAAGPNPAPWIPPAQSAEQAAVFQRAAALAKAASSAATPLLLEALALPSISAALKGCGVPQLAALAPAQLLERIDAEIAVTETVHGRIF